MIKSEGYMAFRGVMRVSPPNPKFPTQEIHGDWLFKPNGYWYCNGHSYDADICEVVEDETP